MEPPGRATVHVGAPKTGTTYLQAVLWRNRDALAKAGVHYPLTRPNEHFQAALDLREMAWGGRTDGPWRGSWDALAARLRTARGSVVLSNELLGGATPEQAARLVDDLAGPRGREVHVVFTARDLARQLASDWQEHMKHRHTVTFTRFVDDLVRLGRDAPAPFGELFWGLHDAAAVLGTWSRLVPAEHLHLVTVPPSGGSDPDLLWRRFAAAAGLGDVPVDLSVRPRNVSLGTAEAELVRRLNEVLRGRFPHPRYDELVRQVLAETVLVARERVTPVSPRPTLPPKRDEWVRARSEEMVRALEGSGIDVVGDLADLIPGPSEGGPQPDTIEADVLLPVALDGLAGVLRHLARARDDLDYWRDGSWRHRLVRFSDRHPWAMPVRRAYSGGASGLRWLRRPPPLRRLRRPQRLRRPRRRGGGSEGTDG